MILVTGASGTIGVRLVRALQARGHAVRGLVLPGDPGAQRLRDLGCEVACGDITRPATLADALAGAHTVYHLAALLLERDEAILRRVNVEGTRNVLRAATEAGVAHLVHVSSASVVYPRSTPYSRSKREGEALVRGQDHVGWTIVRPTLVFGREAGLEFQLFREYVLRYPLVPLVGRGDARKRPVHVDDLVAGLAAIADRPQRVRGQTYNLSGAEVVTLRRMAELILARHGAAHRPVVPVPVPLCRALARGLGWLGSRAPLTASAIAGLTQHADLDPDGACRDLGYSPRGFGEALAACYPLIEARRAAAQGRP